MKLIREVVAEKALQQLITVEPSTSVVDAAELMTRWNVGALLVMEDNRLVGLVTERDYVRSFGAMGRITDNVTVREIMTRHVRMVPGEVTTEESMWLMTYLRLRHLPVMDGGEVLGVVSIGDLIKDVVTEQSHVIDPLEPLLTRGPNA
ncbi:MAG: CBS domain-containing protein [Archangium sp.]